MESGLNSPFNLPKTQESNLPTVSSTDEYKGLLAEGTKINAEQTKILQNFIHSVKYGISAYVAPIRCKGNSCIYAQKCIDGDSLITLVDGSKHKIKDIEIDSFIYSYNEETRKKTISKVLAKKIMGIKTVYSIKTTESEIICTSDHKIHAIKSFRSYKTNFKHVRLEDANRYWLSIEDGLKIGKHIAVSISDPHIEDSKISKEQAILLGYHLADGCFSDKQLTFCNTNKLYIDEYRKCAEFIGSSVSITYRERENRKPSYDLRVNNKNKINPLKDIFINSDLQYKKGISKRVPKYMFSESLDNIALMINRYWSGDGNISKNYGTLTALSENRDLLLDFQILLRKFGIISNVKPAQGHWLINISTQDSIVKFIEKIGIIYGKETNCHFYLDKYKKVIANNSNNKIIENDIRWSKIISITKLNEREVWDIEVENTHNFFANDILVHNCPLLRAGLEVPLEKDCPVERYFVEENIRVLTKDLDIKLEELGSVYDRLLINDLAYYELLDFRASAEMSEDPKIVRREIYGMTPDGEPMISSVTNPIILFKEKVSRAKMKILEELIATRKARSADQRANTRDKSSQVAEMLNRIKKQKDAAVINTELNTKTNVYESVQEPDLEV